ncbi:MAG: hypothetical protein RLY57_690 [Candidatus Parcubacteria bacterium]|jgi:predicted house-cleaning noncanonical NTP pyrophosphatase (MazG superfamily)
MNDLLICKFVRNQVPRLLAASGQLVSVEIILGDEKRRLALLQKLAEEVYEFQHARTRTSEIEEVGDMIEILCAIDRYYPNLEGRLIPWAREVIARHVAHPIHARLIEEARIKKLNLKGGFDWFLRATYRQQIISG